VIQVPGAKIAEDETKTETFYRVKLSINALTDHFYPMIYLKKIDMEEQPLELNQL
jgi:hypothetical protein